jgi:hypothetical protein
MNRLTLIIGSIAILAALACGGSSDPVGRFAGMWEVDIERTLGEMEKHEDLAPLSHDEKVHHIMKYMGQMKLEVSPEAFTLIGKGGPVAMPLEFKSSDADTTVVVLQDRKTTHECTLRKLGRDHMSIRMSSGDNFDLYVWRRTG